MYRHQWHRANGSLRRQIMVSGGEYVEEVDGVEVERRPATPREQRAEERASLQQHADRARARRGDAVQALVGGGLGGMLLEVLVAYGVVPVADALNAGWTPPEEGR